MKILNHISITTTMEVIIMEMILTMEMTLVRTNMTLSGRKTLASCNAIIVRRLDTMHQTVLRRKRKKDAGNSNGNDSNVTQKGHVNHIDMNGNFKEIEEVDVRI